jgi:hypothetical protein
MRRILVEGEAIWVLLDDRGRLITDASAGTQSVYLWAVNPETDEIRFVNEELLAGGEANLVATILQDVPPATELVAAHERAIEKQRGMFEPGACT